MHIEVGRTLLHRVGRSIAETGVSIVKGYSLEDEARVRRIIGNPSSISSDDIDRYRQDRLNSTMPLLGTNMNFFFPVPTNLDVFFEERERQRQLTQKQLIEEVIGDAKGKFKEWKLKPAA